eukprot:4352879-Pyramimonas_sp.AAC.1
MIIIRAQRERLATAAKQAQSAARAQAAAKRERLAEERFQQRAAEKATAEAAREREKLEKQAAKRVALMWGRFEYLCAGVFFQKLLAAKVRGTQTMDLLLLWCSVFPEKDKCAMVSRVLSAYGIARRRCKRGTSSLRRGRADATSSTRRRWIKTSWRDSSLEAFR